MPMGSYISERMFQLFKLNKDFSIEALPNTEKDVVMKRIIESRVFP